MRGVTSYVDGELDEHLSPSILFVVESSVMSFLMREKSYIDVTVGLTPPSIFGMKRKVEEEKSYIAVKDEKSYIQSPSIWRIAVGWRIAVAVAVLVETSGMNRDFFRNE